jgi:hypothetical protein
VTFLIDYFQAIYFLTIRILFFGELEQLKPGKFAEKIDILGLALEKSAKISNKQQLLIVFTIKALYL